MNSKDPLSHDDTQARLEQALKSLEQLERIRPLANAASSVVHDIRNALGVISSTAQFALTKLKPEQQEKEAWKLVDRNVETIKKILKAYLGLARQAGNSKEPCSLNEIAAQVASFVESQARKKGIRIRVEAEPGLPQSLLEIPAIESSLLNMALNSLEAMETGGNLTFRTWTDKAAGRLCLSVEDDGPGMSPETQKKIFTPFFTTKPTGTGMGLYSAKASIESNGGSLSFESAPGKGTKMILSFQA